MSQEEQFDKLTTELSPIQIGDVAGQDAFMSIETNSIKDDALAILLFICVIFTTTIAGIYGPQKYVVGSVQTTFSDQNSLHQIINNLAPIDRYLSLSLFFLTSNGKPANSTAVKFAFALTFRKNGNEMKRSDGQSDVVLRFKNDGMSQPIEFYYDRLISYDEVSVNVEFDETKDLTGGMLQWKYGDPNHSVFQSWVRYVFILTSIIIASLFIYRLKLVERNNWTIEQKLTIVILIASISGANPFYPLLVYFPTLFQAAYHCVLSESFISLTMFFIITIIDNFRLKDKPDKGFFYQPKVAFLIVRIIVGSVVAIGKEDCIFSYEVTNVFRVLLLIVNALFAVYLLVLLILAFKKTDPTSLHTYIVYTIIFILTILFNVLPVFFDKIPFLENTSGAFSMQFSALNCLTILMAYFHWPYERIIDQQYNEAGKEDNENQSFEPEIDEDRVMQKAGGDVNENEEEENDQQQEEEA